MTTVAEPAVDQPLVLERTVHGRRRTGPRGRGRQLLGGLATLQLALSEPERITALCLVDSAGLGRAVKRLPGLTVPTLIVWGQPIGSFPSPTGGERPGGWPAAAWFSCHDARHAPQLECPHSFADALNQFLSA